MIRLALILFMLLSGIRPCLAQSSLSGLWWNPSESGWGITLDHQAEFVFATWFIYGADGKPYWVVGQLQAASSSDSTPSFSGPVYATSGSPYSSPFDAAQTKAEQVGQAILTTTGTNSADLEYSIGSVTKRVSIIRQATKAIRPDESYDGSVELTIATTNGSVSINANYPFLQCSYTGGYAQYGPRLNMSGTYKCSDLTTGSWSTSDFTITDGVFLHADVKQTTSAGVVTTVEWLDQLAPGGSIIVAGSQRDTSPKPTLTGLWWNPQESGWGLTLDQQSGFLFATLFVYDQTGKPSWFVAQMNAASAAQTSFSGPLYLTSGTPYSSDSFDAGTTTATNVGTASLDLLDGNHARFSFTVNGTQTEKEIERQAAKPVSVAGYFDGYIAPGIFGVDPASFQVSQTNQQITITMQQFGTDDTCQYVGATRQFGFRLSASGNYQCGLNGTGTWHSDNITMLDDGIFTGTIFIGNGSGTSLNLIGKITN